MSNNKSNQMSDAEIINAINHPFWTYKKQAELIEELVKTARKRKIAGCWDISLVSTFDQVRFCWKRHFASSK